MISIKLYIDDTFFSDSIGLKIFHNLNVMSASSAEYFVAKLIGTSEKVFLFFPSPIMRNFYGHDPGKFERDYLSYDDANPHSMSRTLT